MAPPSAPDSPSPGSLAALLRTRQGELFARWLRRVLDDPQVPAAHRLSLPSLQNDLPALLDHLADTLDVRRSLAPSREAAGRVAGGDGESHAHAAARFREGYTLPAALRELSHLREAVLDLCEAEGLAMSPDEARFFHAALDETMATSAGAIHAAAQAELRASEARHTNVVQSVMDAIITVDAGQRVVLFNPAAERIFRCTAAEARGAPLGRFIPERFRGVHRAHVARFGETGETVRAMGASRTLAALRADGEEFPIQATIAQTDAGGERLFTVVLRDVTEQVAAERLLRDAHDRLRLEGEYRELMLGVLAHDLRTPLSAIVYAGAALLQRDDLPDGVARLAARVSSSGRRMATLIAQLLDFTRARAGGGIPLMARATDLAEIARTAIDELEPSRHERSVSLTTAGDTAGTWDGDRLAQVVANLVGNALTHSPPKSPVEVLVSDRGAVVELSVRNVGAPIPSEVRPTLFDPFRRATSARDGAASEGLGLGLYISSEIVRAHGGEITVASDHAQGTVFTVSLPRSPRA